jgi:hypothetical protein
MKVALLIGINYTSIPESTLQGCINDITNMRNVLISKYGYDASNITMLRDDDTSKMPTHAAMLTAFNDIVIASKSKSCTEVWIHYSGHGSRVKDINGDEKSGFDSVIIPLDFKTAGSITDDVIFQYIKQIPCPTIILMDSCNSGTVCDLEWSFEYLNGSKFSRTRNSTNQKMVINPNIIMLSGCKDIQTSADIYDPEDKQPEGAFTDAFLRALKQNQYKGPAWSVYRDTCIGLNKNGYTQKPIISGTSPNMLWNFNPSVLKKTIEIGENIVGSGKSILPSQYGVKQKMTMNMTYSP